MLCRQSKVGDSNVVNKRQFLVLGRARIGKRDERDAETGLCKTSLNRISWGHISREIKEDALASTKA